MRGRAIGVFALLSAGASHAERVSEPYAKVGDWEITAENHRECAMRRFYAGSVADEDQALMVLYDGQRKAAALSWASPKPKLPPLAASLDLNLAFSRKGSSMNESWGSQPFQIGKPVGAYTFTHVFKGSADTARFFSDLTSSDTIGLWLGPTLMTGLPLNASDAVIKLRECSSKIAEQDMSDRLQR